MGVYASALAEAWFDCVLVLCFVVGYAPQFGGTAHKRVHYHYYYVKCRCFKKHYASNSKSNVIYIIIDCLLVAGLLLTRHVQIRSLKYSLVDVTCQWIIHR